MVMRRKIVLIAMVIIIMGCGLFAWRYHATTSRTRSNANSSHGQAKTQHTTPDKSFDKQQYSLTDPASIWVIVNKQRPLNPRDYAPADLVVPNVALRVPGNESMQLRKQTAAAIETMFTAAKQQSIELMLSSGYRSYSYQVSLYSGYVKSQGTVAADTFSARPGYSEHQTGLAADIEPLSQKCDVDKCFADLPEGKWLAANAYKYGFVIRYPEGKTPITGYEPEPWHIRYIGVAAATEVHDKQVATLEQFFGLPAAPGY